MNNCLKLFIRNPNTNEQLWFSQPFNMNKIRETLHIQGDEYEIIDANSSMPIHSYSNIEYIQETYDKYILLPEYIKNNIYGILTIIENIKDIFNAVIDNTISLYPNCKDKYDFARELLRTIDGVPDKLINYIDLNRYLDDIDVDSHIIETPDGVIEIKK